MSNIANSIIIFSQAHFRITFAWQCNKQSFFEAMCFGDTNLPGFFYLLRAGLVDVFFFCSLASFFQRWQSFSKVAFLIRRSFLDILKQIFDSNFCSFYLTLMMISSITVLINSSVSKETDSRKSNTTIKFILLSVRLISESEFDFSSSLLKHRALKLS